MNPCQNIIQPLVKTSAAIAAKIILACILLLNSLQVSARDPVFSQFYAAPIYLNPAFAGSTNCSRMAFSYRHWRGIDNFHALNFSYDIYSERLQGGLGIIATSDLSNFDMTRTNISGMYSYHLRATENINIHFAVQAGYIRNDSRLKPDDFADPAEPLPDNMAGHDLDLSAGILLFSDRVYGGIAAHHMNDPNMSLLEDEEFKPGIKYTAHLGLYLEPSQTAARPGERSPYFFSPNFIYQRETYHQHVSAGMYFGTKPVMLGTWLRHHRFRSQQENQNDTESKNTLVFLAGINMGDYRIGYSYDYPVGNSGFSNILTVHEISLAWRFNCSNRNIGGRIINYPRF